MAEAKRDQNHVTTALFESSTTPGLTLNGKIDEITGRILVTSGGGGSGTVTSVSVVTANGFAGSVANPTTTPAITISTTLGAGQIPVSNGTGFQSAPVTGTGNIVLATSPTFSGATITTSTVNGVTLVSGGSATLYLSQDGTYTTPAGGSASPGAPTNSIQFNSAGSFAGSSTLLFNGTDTITLGAEDATFSINAADATTPDSDGASVEINAGSGDGTGADGTISLHADTSGFVSISTGSDAAINVSDNDILNATTSNLYRYRGNGVYGILDFATVTGTNKTFTFPNTSGTIALVGASTGSNAFAWFIS